MCEALRELMKDEFDALDKKVQKAEEERDAISKKLNVVSEELDFVSEELANKNAYIKALEARLAAIGAM